MSVALFDYWRSSASYRVRIGLNLKGIAAAPRYVNLRAGEQRQGLYPDLNPQMLVPTLVDDNVRLGQSLAILEYLDETHPEPRLLPTDAPGRGVVRWMSQIVASDIHPINNLRVLSALREQMGADDGAIELWARRWIGEGLSALEALARVHSADDGHCYGDRPTLADICLVPQLYSARRFGLSLKPYPLLSTIEAHLVKIPAFRSAYPDHQADCPSAAL